ncbi:ATP-binding protein [Flavobacterium hydrophilum]|uniref:ATP-binding protein n=1 Tax=Flavobacterium hydrophilum TaxID=2211445 RepID=A0A2V4C0F3_9FLAO|nr:ATP-binding protein [Flavobacterium hydrophilum]PXY44771.1 ATP-binding protein [Flavobacterium hydrophilum]
MIIYFENNITSDWTGYQKLINLVNDASKIKDENIIFDFAGVHFFEANLCAVLGTMIEILENENKKITFQNFNNSVQKILCKNEFLSNHGFEKAIDHYDTVVKYRKFNPTDDEGFNTYIKKELLSKKDFPSHSEKLGKKIMQNIFELYENARTHGKCNFIHTCGQYFPNSLEKQFNITIVDRGVNIKENVNRFLKNENELSSCDAISWAMQKGNTTKSGNIPGGLGLDIIFEFIKLNNGKIQIISSNGFWEYKRGVTETKILENPFQGTIANLRFNLNDKSYYSLAEEHSENWDFTF